MQKAVASSGRIWAGSNLKKFFEFFWEKQSEEKSCFWPSFAHEGSGEPALLWGLFPPGLWLFAVVPPKETPLALPVLEVQSWVELCVFISQCSWALVPCSSLASISPVAPRISPSLRQEETAPVLPEVRVG